MNQALANAMVADIRGHQASRLQAMISAEETGTKPRVKARVKWSHSTTMIALTSFPKDSASKTIQRHLQALRKAKVVAFREGTWHVL